MSSPGITAINSGPLIIRTYVNSSINNSYVTQEFDYPVSSNRLLITSTGGCLVPSDSITISSINTSSFFTGSLSASTIVASSIVTNYMSSNVLSSVSGYVSSLTVSSIAANSMMFSTVIASSIGIGTTTPQTALDVVGTVNVSSVTSTITYDVPGTYPITLPPGVKSIEFEMIGAGGLGDTLFTGVGGGTGGYMKGTIELPSNLTYLNVVVGAAGSGGTPAGASYINVGTSPSPATALLAIAGAGGSGTTFGLGGEGGGGTFSSGVAPGGDGVGTGNGEGGSMSGPTNGGVGGSGCSSGSGVAGGSRPFPEDYEQALGGTGVPGNPFNIYAGGSGYTGGGSGCGGGGGSSYYDDMYTTIIATVSGSGVTTELPGFGRSNQGGKLILTIHYAALSTNGDIVARNICANHITISSIFSLTPPLIYSTAGTYTSIAIPRGTTSIEFEMIGAGGRDNVPFSTDAGTGGYIKGTIIVPIGISTIKVQVGALGGTTNTPSGASYITIPTSGPLFAMVGAGGHANPFAAGFGGGGGGGVVDINGVYPGENGSPCTAPGICGGGGSQLGSVNGGTPGYRCDGNLAFPGQPGANYANNYEESSGGAGSTGFGYFIVAGGNGYAGGGSGCAGGGGSSYADPTYTYVYDSFSGSTVPPSILSGTYGRTNQDGYVSLQFITAQNSLTANGDILCNNIQANGTISVPNGSVVIGSGAGNYPLEVTATPIQTNFNTGWRYGNAGDGANVPPLTDGINVKSTAGIWAPIFYATSDRRMKQEINSIRDDEALQVVRKIDPVRYKYIDSANRHNEQEYGFIAQDVKSVLPYAVRTETDFVPNVYDVAEFTKIDEHTTMITLRNKTMEHIQINDLIKLIDLKEKHIILKISDINYNYVVVDVDLSKVVSKPSLTSQDIANGVKTNTVFVYGTQVSDLHILNKEAIYSVSIAAMQELDRVIQHQQHVIVEQGDKIKALEDKIGLLFDKPSS